MGKKSLARVLGDSQAKAIGRNIRTSPRKLNLVAQTIRGKRAEAAEWPWKLRVGENSPSLWPTMSSVTSTGICLWPL